MIEHSEIVVDDRESASGLAEELQKLTAVAVTVRRLAIGDIEIGNEVVVERKKTEDFVSSLLDGRFQRQIQQLEISKKVFALLLEGDFNQRALAGMAPQTVRQAILTLQIEWRIPLIRSRDLEDSVRWIAALAERKSVAGQQVSRFYDPKRMPTAPHPAGHRAGKPRAVTNPQAVPIAALQRIPGIGGGKAMTLIEHFGSMQKLLAAGEAEIAVVDGIGPALARAVYHGLRGGR